MRCLASDRPLSARTLGRFAQNGYVIRVRESEIEDRSKSTVMTKLLILVQVGWMYLQSIMRLQQGLPLSLLEFHTTMISIFCVAMYILWFKVCAKSPYSDVPRLTRECLETFGCRAAEGFRTQRRGRLQSFSMLCCCHGTL